MLTVNRHLRPNAQYDPLRDLAPASLTFKSDHVVVVGLVLQLPVWKNTAWLLVLRFTRPT